MSDDEPGYRTPIRPPKAAEWLLSLFLSDENLDFVSGDLAEIFETVILPTYGPAQAKFWYWNQVVRSVGFFLRRRMLKSWKGSTNMDKLGDAAEYHRGIRVDRIPVEGAVGLLFVFATLFIFGVGIPAVRGLLLITGSLGIFGSGILYFWHKHHHKKFQSLHFDSPARLIRPDKAGTRKD